MLRGKCTAYRSCERCECFLSGRETSNGAYSDVSNGGAPESILKNAPGSAIGWFLNGCLFGNCASNLLAAPVSRLRHLWYTFSHDLTRGFPLRCSCRSGLVRRFNARADPRSLAADGVEQLGCLWADHR